MSRAVMQQALEALEEAHWKIEHKQDAVKRGQAITALKQALAEPEQEPISLNNGRLTQYPDGRIGFGTPESVGAIGHAPTPRKPQTTHWEGCEAVHPECKAAPTPRRPVELTDEQIVQVLGSVRESITGSVFLAFAHAVIAEYKRKNGIGEQK